MMKIMIKMMVMMIDHLSRQREAYYWWGEGGRRRGSRRQPLEPKPEHLESKIYVELEIQRWEWVKNKEWKTSASVAKLVTGASSRRFLRRQSKTKGVLKISWKLDRILPHSKIIQWDKEFKIGWELAIIWGDNIWSPIQCLQARSPIEPQRFQ